MTSTDLRSLDSDIGILIVGHGSRNALAVKEFASFITSLKQFLPDVPIGYGYLEFARPIISEALDSLREQGVKKVIAIPLMLFAAGHAKK